MAGMFTALDRYLFRTALFAFLVVAASLTAIVWITQALGRIDLVTTQHQTVLVFLGITLLFIPILQLIIAPFAFVVALLHTLDRLHADSEIIVLSAAGVSPWRLFRPFLALAVLVAVLVGFISAYLAPRLERERQDRLVKLRAELIDNIVQPGQFVRTEGGLLTFHVRERRHDGTLLGILVDDRRNPEVRDTFLAEQGSILKRQGTTFLVLERGSEQRAEKGRDPSLVLFDRYALDLSQFSKNAATPRERGFSERYLWQLAFADPEEPLVKREARGLSQNLHDRLVAPIYPIAFVMVGFALAGAPRSNRQNRIFPVALAIVGVFMLRFVGYACIIVALKTPAAILVLYACLMLAVALGAFAIARGIALEPPAAFANALFGALQPGNARTTARRRSGRSSNHD
jgi:lipopolysaccharide export system permease protein